MWRSISGLFGYENDVSVEPNLEIFGGVRKVRTRWKPGERSFFLLSKSLESNKQRLHRGIITVHHINTGFLRRLLLPLDDKVVKNARRYWNCQRNSQRSTVGLTLGSRNDCSRFSSSSALLDVSPIPDCCLKSVSLRCCQKKLQWHARFLVPPVRSAWISKINSWKGVQWFCLVDALGQQFRVLWLNIHRSTCTSTAVHKTEAYTLTGCFIRYTCSIVC